MSKSEHQEKVRSAPLLKWCCIAFWSTVPADGAHSV